jgi:hypothetical protein
MKPFIGTPYVYLIGWKKKNVYYYGVRYAKGCDPSDLFTTYFTSSKHVKRFIKENGNSDIISIRKTFNNVNDAQQWEHKVLRRMNVKERFDFLNKTDNISISYEAGAEGGRKGGKKSKGMNKPWVSEINKKKVGSLNPMWGKTGVLSPCYVRIGEKHPMFGKKNPKSSEAMKATIHCPHCNKIGNVPNMKRWHFDNCKQKQKIKEN